jgi:hypothetical protein
MLRFTHQSSNRCQFECFAHAAIRDLEAQQFDVTNAFLNVSPEETICVELPRGSPRKAMFAYCLKVFVLSLPTTKGVGQGNGYPVT